MAFGTWDARQDEISFQELPDNGETVTAADALLELDDENDRYVRTGYDVPVDEHEDSGFVSDEKIAAVLE